MAFRCPAVWLGILLVMAAVSSAKSFDLAGDLAALEDFDLDLRSLLQVSTSA